MIGLGFLLKVSLGKLQLSPCVVFYLSKRGSVQGLAMKQMVKKNIDDPYL